MSDENNESKDSKQIADANLENATGLGNMKDKGNSELPEQPLNELEKQLKEDIPLEQLENIPTNPDQMEEFKGVDDSMIPESGEDNAPPLELTPEVEKEILKKQSEDDEKRKAISSKTEHYLNGKNEWKLIAKTYNNALGHEHVTMAMAVGTRGIIVHVKEAIDQRINATSVFIDNGKLLEENGKWIIK